MAIVTGTASGSAQGNGSTRFAAGPVDVSNWSFYSRPPTGTAARPTPYLVGPIVGAVTETTAR